ncbi:MAG TPA: DUF6265 family protein [Thermoanaerobaculia bacterium]|jgi:hypothetical protein|nr:DUF6265 family protein [Thermoanaerobaculia bacterium]
MQRRLLIALLVLLPAGSAFAQAMPDWMSGAWASDNDGVRMEEHWTKGGAGLMVGMHQDLTPDGKTSFEFLRIERREGKLVYLAMPHARPETPFPAKSVEATRIVFENPDHDYPQRIIYWRDGARLCARTEGTIKSKASSEEWCWRRMAP